MHYNNNAKMGGELLKIKCSKMPTLQGNEIIDNFYYMVISQ